MNLQNIKNLSEFKDKSLLIVDDDNPFRERLARAMEKKGFQVVQAEGVKKGIESVKNNKPAWTIMLVGPHHSSKTSSKYENKANRN